MSAAEPATPPTSHAEVNDGGGAAVIPFTARRAGRGAYQPSRGNTVEPTPLPTPGPPVSDSERAVREAALRIVADDVEKIFNQTGRTLTDDETAAVYAMSLQIAQHTLKGSVVSGILSEEQHGELDVLLAGLKEAPRLV